MWEIDPVIDIQRVGLEDVKFVFAQAEKRLNDTVKTGESIASKTMSMITLMAGVLIALSGFFISNWKGLPWATDKDLLAIIGSLYILGLFIFMITEPKELMIPQFFDKAVQPDKITIFIYMSEIENYNLRIEKNLIVNTQRWRKYKLSVIAFLILPVILGLLYTIMEWLF